MRKQSDTTKLRHAKREIKVCWQRLNAVEEELRLRRHVGSVLANISWNVARKDTDPDLSSPADEWRKAWDAIEKVPNV